MPFYLITGYLPTLNNSPIMEMPPFTPQKEKELEANGQAKAKAEAKVTVPPKRTLCRYAHALNAPIFSNAHTPPARLSPPNALLIFVARPLLMRRDV